MDFPGFIVFTSIKPTDTATTVVIIYINIVLVPIFDSLEISFKSDTPLINAAKIKGIAISFNELINIVPKGLIQS